MSKACLVLPLVLLSDPNPATTVNLKMTSCTATRICYSVVNDGINADRTPLQVDYISASATYGRVTASLNGVLWDSGMYAVYPMPLNLTNVTLYDAAGHHVILNAQYTHWVTLNHSGHNYYVQHWRLDGGTIYFP
jgi:hypothetical protein